jgi:transcriptional regulator with XRE-family HTH domain
MKVTRLGARIVRLRKGKGWSQIELARSAKMDQGLLSRLEDGIGNPSLKTIAAIAKALDVSVSELTQGV